jgi:hypothetical protein
VFAAVLDTCVLWPSLQRDFLLSMAIEGLYRPLWSSAILAELEEHEARKRMHRGERPRDARASAKNLIAQLRTHFDDACVEGWEPLEGSFGLPDPDDEHVVAAAVIGGAGAIVTDNVKDMPAEKVPRHIQVVRPAVFAAESVEISPEHALRALAMIARRHRNPRHTIDELIDLLEERYAMEDAAAQLRAALGN